MLRYDIIYNVARSSLARTGRLMQGLSLEGQVRGGSGLEESRETIVRLILTNVFLRLDDGGEGLCAELLPAQIMALPVILPLRQIMRVRGVIGLRCAVAGEIVRLADAVRRGGLHLPYGVLRVHGTAVVGVGVTVVHVAHVHACGQKRAGCTSIFACTKGLARRARVRRFSVSRPRAGAFAMFTVDIVIRLVITVARLRVRRSLGVLHGQGMVQTVLQSLVLGVVRRRWLCLLAVTRHEARSDAAQSKQGISAAPVCARAILRASLDCDSSSNSARQRRNIARLAARARARKRQPSRKPWAYTYVFESIS